ncbi:hypothetical protein NE857_31465 [Nocardiopsis exhalans]|uniref:Uncharacterized protein n=1 Tax=Nocardiopsis exhalans TaxID=163604 RepID=A0ABY5D869_9ACTN|nr:hypothetical protein [Nocardiopsis exhalans]USY19698.1 hypothetical protein NE857_31465 [Nocardiopsis exhalans]
MSPSTTSADRAEAIDAVAWYLTRRDQTPAAERADPEIEAAEIVQALMVRGWRRTEARPALPWQPDPTGRPADPADVHRHAAQARAALTQTTTSTEEDS